jgi:hypothetical protein
MTTMLPFVLLVTRGRFVAGLAAAANFETMVLGLSAVGYPLSARQHDL